MKKAKITNDEPVIRVETPKLSVMKSYDHSANDEVMANFNSALTYYCNIAKQNELSIMRKISENYEVMANYNSAITYYYNIAKQNDVITILYENNEPIQNIMSTTLNDSIPE